jgi:hypothetical protein
VAAVVTPLLTLIVSKHLYQYSRSAFKVSIYICFTTTSLVCLGVALRLAFDSVLANACVTAIAYVSVCYLFSSTGAVKYEPLKAATQLVLGPLVIVATIGALLYVPYQQNTAPIYVEQHSGNLSCHVYSIGTTASHEPLIEAEVHQRTQWLPGIHRLVHARSFSEQTSQPVPSAACTDAFTLAF